MAKKRIINLEFPLGGLNKRFAIQKQPPFTTVDALNVRPDGTLEQRTRGGSRPGLAKAFSEKLGSGNPINMLAQVRSVAKTGSSSWIDDFNGSGQLDSQVWDSGSWAATLPNRSGGKAISGLASTQSGESGAARKLITAFDISKIYKVTMNLSVADVTGETVGYRIYAAMDDTSPDALQDGIWVDIDLRESGVPVQLTVTVVLKSYKSGIVQSTGTNLVLPIPYPPGQVPLSLEVNGTTATVRVGTQTIVSHTVASGLTGTRLGFGIMQEPPEPNFRSGKVEFFRADYFITQNVEANRNFVVAASNELVYVQNQTVLDTVSTSLTIASDRLIASQSRAGSLYIADHSDPSITGDDGQINGSNILSATGVSDWAPFADGDDDIVVITNGSGATVNGNYRIASISGTQLTLATAPGNGDPCSYRIERALKKFDPQTSTLSVVVESAGFVPAGNPVIALYQDRLTLAGAALAPHVWYMSKQGDPTNWSLGGTSAARAVAGTTADAGQHPEPIIALAPFHDDYLIFGGLTSLWVLRGNPATVGGFLDNISYEIGILDKRAWAYDPRGGLYFIGRAGLYYLTPGAVGEPQPVSESKLPAELVNIDVTANDVMLAYDIAARGLHICITPKLGGVTTQWWLDTETELITKDARTFKLYGFWKVSLDADHHAFSLLSYDADSPNDAGVLLGCKDGFIRKFSNSFISDDGTAISSHVLIGPVALGGGEYLEGKVKEILATLDDSSGDVTYSILTGDSAEAASTATAASTGTIKKGANNSIRPMGRGRYFYLKLANGDGNPWAVESIIAKLARAGRFRK